MLLQRAWPVRRSIPYVVLGIIQDPEGRLYYAGDYDIYPDAESFMRVCEAAGGRLTGETVLAWCRYPKRSATDVELLFRRQRRSAAVWCQPILSS